MMDIIDQQAVATTTMMIVNAAIRAGIVSAEEIEDKIQSVHLAVVKAMREGDKEVMTTWASRNRFTASTGTAPATGA